MLGVLTRASRLSAAMISPGWRLRQSSTLSLQELRRSFSFEAVSHSIQLLENHDQVLHLFAGQFLVRDRFCLDHNGSKAMADPSRTS
jgi:hypothetical protein